MLVAVATLAASWVIARRVNPPRPPRDPVSVLIADFDNRTNDPVFSGSVEQALAVGVEGASFITTYPRRDAVRLAPQFAAGDKLDRKPPASSQCGRRQVRRVWVDRANGSAYTITASLIDPAVNKTLKTERVSARSKAEVLESVGTFRQNPAGSGRLND